MSYIVDLEAFHGPLDLLLYLIEKNEVDIYDIPIAKITDQYIDYINVAGHIDLEQIGDFLIIASYLLFLKSKMLLPKHEPEDKGDDYEADPREELVQRLLEYKKFKEAANYLAEVMQEDNLTFFRSTDFEPEINEVLVAEVKLLVNAYKEVLARMAAQNYTPILEIPVSDVNVTDKMQELLEELYNNPLGISLQDLFAGATSRREVLAYFLALLELMRLQKVSAQQKNIYDVIIINLVGDGS